jgi:hypothetical protein
MASYTQERDQCIARLTAEGLRLPAIHTLLRSATTMQRLAELACSSEAADRDRVPCPGTPCLCDYDGEHHDVPRIRVQDWHAEQRAAKALPSGWSTLTQGDPRGAVLRVVPPSYAERNAGRDIHNREGIYIPARPSRLQF